MGNGCHTWTDVASLFLNQDLLLANPADFHFMELCLFFERGSDQYFHVLVGPVILNYVRFFTKRK